MTDPVKSTKGTVHTATEEERDAGILDHALSSCGFTVTELARTVGSEVLRFLPPGPNEVPMRATDRLFVRRILEEAVKDPLPFRVLSLQLSMRELGRDTEARLHRGRRP